MTDTWLIVLCGGMFLCIPAGLLFADWRSKRRRRAAANAHTALWNDEIGTPRNASSEESS